MNAKSIGTIEAIGMILTIIIAHIIIYLPEKIISEIGSSSILNILYITAIIFAFTLIIVKLFKNFDNYDILDISNFLGGPILKKILTIITVGYAIFFAGLFIRDFSECLKILYFNDFKITYIFFIFLLGTFIVNKYGLRKVIRCNLLILPTILVAIIIVEVASFPKFTYQRVFPVLGYGIDKTFILGATNISAFSNFVLLYYIIPLLKDKKCFTKISFLSMGLSALLLFSTVSTLLLVHSFSGSQSVLSIYLATRAISFGSFLQRPDSLFILIWILSMFSYLALITGVSCYLVDKDKPHPKRITLLTIITLTFIVGIIPKNISELSFLENVILKYFAIGLVFGLNLIILIIANLKLRFSTPKPIEKCVKG